MAAKVSDQFFELLVRVGPVARPPGAESEARRQRNAAGDAGVIAQRVLRQGQIEARIEMSSIGFVETMRITNMRIDGARIVPVDPGFPVSSVG